MAPKLEIPSNIRTRKKAVITGNEENINNGENGLGLSEQKQLIERPEETSGTEDIGIITTAK